MEQTTDPTVNIVNRTSEYKEYESIYGEKWRIYGTCNACGLCENRPESIPSVVQETHRIMAPNGDVTFWHRTLRWHSEPGVPNAVSEDGFDSRPDCPMRPEYVNSIEGCTLSGEQVDGN